MPAEVCITISEYRCLRRVKCRSMGLESHTDTTSESESDTDSESHTDTESDTDIESDTDTEPLALKLLGLDKVAHIS